MNTVNKVFQFLAGTSIICCFLLFGCNDPSLVGDDLITDDVIDVQYVDTFTILTRPIVYDSLIAYNRESNIQADFGYIGILNDANFGRSEYSMYVQYRTLNPRIDNPGFIVDSVVLEMKYDSTLMYGDSLSQLHEISVSRIVDPAFNGDGSYTTDQDILTDNIVLGSKGPFDAKPRRPYVLVFAENDTAVLQPQLRIRLDNTLGEELLSLDSSELVSDAQFTDIFRGLHIYPTALSQELLAFDYIDLVNSGVTVFYRIPDTSASGFEHRQLNLITTDFRPLVQHVERDLSGSIQQMLLGDGSDVDSIVFIEGLDGNWAEIEIPSLEDFGKDKVLILKAELEVRTAEINGLRYTDFPAASIVRTTRLSDGNFISTDEFRESFASNGSPGIYGGFAELVESDFEADYYRYTFNLSRTIQEIVDGDIPNVIRLNAYPRIGNPRRSILYGTNSSYPMQIRITYTTNN